MPPARPARLRRRHRLCWGRDRRRPDARAVLRRLHPHLGQHDRHRARGALGGLLVRRQARRPRPVTARLYHIVLFAAVLLAAIPFVADPFLTHGVEALDSISAGAFLGSLLGVLGLVAMPVFVMGMVSP